MHYEGNEYPDYVPILLWEEFSIPDMKPDIVFIHNPYDEINYVTCVHPAFYSSNLKNYTKEDGLLSLTVATERAQMSTEEFQKQL